MRYLVIALFFGISCFSQQKQDAAPALPPALPLVSDVKENVQKPAAQASLIEGKRIAVVDLKKVFENYNKTKDSTKLLEDEFGQKKKDLESKLKEIEGMRQSFQLQKTMYSSEKQKEEEKRITDAAKDFQIKYQEVLKATNDRQNALTDKLINEILEVIKAVYTEEKFDLVFDKKSLFFGGEEITDIVLKRLNEKK
jgi:Skp family chaperone for outer membrane proteins